MGELWSQSRQREKEIELIWIGEQFRQAIGLYYHRSAGAVKRYPSALEDLLQDPRFPNPQRYLRKIYNDPMSGKPEWALIPAPEGGIMGVHSLVHAPALRQVGGSTYSDWHFVYEPVGARR